MNPNLESAQADINAAQKDIDALGQNMDALSQANDDLDVRNQKLSAQLASAPLSVLRGMTVYGGLHMLPGKNTDNLEVPGVWIDSGGHTAQSSPGTSKLPHGVGSWTPGTFTTPGRLFFTPAAGWDNIFEYERFPVPAALPTYVVGRRVFSFSAGDRVNDNCVEWQDEFTMGGKRFNLAWQWNFSSKLFRYFDQNAQAWHPSAVPFVDLGATPIEVIGEFLLDPVGGTTTHMGLTVAGNRTALSITQPATPVPGAKDKYTISLCQLDSLGQGKPFGVNIHACESRFL